MPPVITRGQVTEALAAKQQVSKYDPGKPGPQDPFRGSKRTKLLFIIYYVGADFYTLIRTAVEYGGVFQKT